MSSLIKFLYFQSTLLLVSLVVVHELSFFLPLSLDTNDLKHSYSLDCDTVPRSVVCLVVCRLFVSDIYLCALTSDGCVAGFMKAVRGNVSSEIIVLIRYCDITC